MSEVTLAVINEKYLGTMAKSMGMKVTEMGPGVLVGEMPVGPNIKQPFGIVHGGAYCTFGETLGSIGANIAAEPGKQVVGTSLTASYIKKVESGILRGYAKAYHSGRRTGVWQIEIKNSEDQLVAVMTLQTMVL